jgi:hypothetical protein
VFSTFQELRDSKKGKVREHGLEFFRRTKWDKVGHQEANRPQMRPAGAVSQPGRATSTRLRLEPPMSSVFAWFCSSWPKTNYKKGPMGVPERRQWRNTKNTKQGLLLVAGGRLEGEPMPELPPVTSSPSPMPPPWSPPWGGSSSPPRLWFCGGNLVQSLYVLSFVEVHMMCLAWLWNYLCNSYGGYCVMRWYLSCIYYCVETFWFLILWN